MALTKDLKVCAVIPVSEWLLSLACFYDSQLLTLFSSVPVWNSYKHVFLRTWTTMCWGPKVLHKGISKPFLYQATQLVQQIESLTLLDKITSVLILPHLYIADRMNIRRSLDGNRITCRGKLQKTQIIFTARLGHQRIILFSAFKVPVHYWKRKIQLQHISQAEKFCVGGRIGEKLGTTIQSHRLFSGSLTMSQPRGHWKTTTFTVP